MKKILYICLMLPTVAFSQTAMVLDMAVWRGHECQDERVLFVTDQEMMGILTRTDTLQLQRMYIVQSSRRQSVILGCDRLHGNQPIQVRYTEGPCGVVIELDPFVERTEASLRAFAAVKIRPDAFGTSYKITLRSTPCP